MKIYKAILNDERWNKIHQQDRDVDAVWLYKNSKPTDTKWCETIKGARNEALDLGMPANSVILGVNFRDARKALKDFMNGKPHVNGRVEFVKYIDRNISATLQG